jgi:hypothetical protein
VYEAAEWASNSNEATLGGVLKYAQGDAGAMGDSLRLLEQRDSVVEKAHNRPAVKNQKLKRDPFGRVLLDQSYKRRPKALDADGALMDPAEFEKRLSRARKLDSRYAGDAGRDAFRFDDDAHLRGGTDLVKTLELNVAERAAHAEAGQVARQLDQSIRQESDRRQQVKLLDEQLADLTGKRRELEAPAPTDTSGLRMLDQTGTAGGKKGKKKLSKIERLEELGKTLPPTEFLKALDAYVATGDVPEPAREPEPATAPPGVDPGSHAMHDRVQERMRLLDVSYQDAYEGILAETTGTPQRANARLRTLDGGS